MNKSHSSILETIDLLALFQSYKFVFISFLWPYLRFSLASIGNIWWVLDHTWMSCALEQPEVLRSCVNALFLLCQVLVATTVFSREVVFLVQSCSLPEYEEFLQILHFYGEYIIQSFQLIFYTFQGKHMILVLS